MKAVSTTIVVLLVLLAVSSGIAKILLMEQDVVFFAKYGFSNPILITYGLTQLFGGLLMIVAKTRLAGAITVAITFLVSLVLLLIEGNIPVSIITVVATLLLGVVIKQNWPARAE